MNVFFMHFLYLNFKIDIKLIDIKLSSVDSIHSVLHSFTLVDSRIPVLDFC